MDSKKIINTIQLHVEKIILGICALILVIIVVSWLFGSSYNVRMSGQMVAPAQVPKNINDQAKKLKEKLNSKKTIKTEPVPSYLDAFKKQHSKPAIAFVNTNLAPIGTTGLSSNLSEVSYSTYTLPDVPITTDPIAKAGYGALGQIEDSEKNRKVLKLINKNKRPYDFRYVTVAATFDLSKWKKNYKAISKDNNPVPRSWFTSNIAGVYLQRKTWDAKKDKWSNPTIIAPLPTQYGFTDAKQNWDSTQRQENEKQIKTHQQEVMQPKFVPLANGEIWQRPYITHALLTDRDQRQLKSLRNNIKRLNHQQDQINEHIKTIQDRIEKIKENSNNKNQSNSQLDRSITSLEKRLYKIQMQLYRNLYTRNNLLMWPVPPAPKRPSAVKSTDSDEPNWLSTLNQQRKQNEPKKPELKDGQVRVWAYDITAKPDVKYRYRVIVAMVNPLFNKGAVAAKQQEENIDKYALAPSKQKLEKADKSSWVTVKTAPKYYFFFLTGSAEQKSAQIEVWRLYNGIWRNKRFRTKPGDLIGGVADIKMENDDTKSVDMQTQDFMVDLVSNSEAGSQTNMQFLYLDSATGKVLQRLMQNDRASLQRTSLENQQAVGKHQMNIFRNSNGQVMPYATPKERKDVTDNRKKNRNHNPRNNEPNPDIP